MSCVWQCVLRQLPGLHPASAHASFLAQAAVSLLAAGGQLDDRCFLSALASTLPQCGCSHLLVLAVLKMDKSRRLAADCAQQLSLQPCQECFRETIQHLAAGRIAFSRARPVLLALLWKHKDAANCLPLHSLLRGLEGAAVAQAVGQLLELGVDPNQCDKQGRSALFDAVATAHTRCCELLLNAGCDQDTLDGSGRHVIEVLCTGSECCE